MTLAGWFGFRLQGRLFLLNLLTALLLAIAPSGAATADIMQTCTSEIGTYCQGVRSGRGRIAACLFAHSANVSGACATDLETISSSRSIQQFVPAGITQLKGTSYEQELRQACTADAAQLCPGVPTSDERVLACLYARERSLSRECKQTGERVLRQVR